MRLRSSLWFAAVPLAALAVALLLAFVAATVPQASHATLTTVAAPAARSHPTLALPTIADQPPRLWEMLAPRIFDADALAVLGLVLVLIVRYNTRHRRGARE